MDLSDLFNLLIVGAVVFGPMLAKMKMAKNANKAKGLGTSGPVDAGTGLRQTPTRPAAAGAQRPIPRRPIEPAAKKRRRKIVPAAPTVKAAKPAKARPAPPRPSHPSGAWQFTAPSKSLDTPTRGCSATRNARSPSSAS